MTPPSRFLFKRSAAAVGGRLGLALLLLSTSARLQAQSTLQAQLEVNLGPINIDQYDGKSPNTIQGIATGANIPACSFNGAQSNYRDCMRFVLSDYNQQGVTGVRFQFGMTGDAFSTPFVAKSGALSAAWIANFSLFMQDLRAANIQYVSFTPAWLTWYEGNMTSYACISGPPYTYDFSCTSSNANAEFYPWLPFPLTYVPGQGHGGPFDDSRPLAYSESPTEAAFPGAWRWSASAADPTPLFTFFDAMFAAVANAQLQVREVELIPEIPMWASSIWGRFMYDNVQQVHPLDIINQILQGRQLAPVAVISTAASQPGNNLDCTSLYGDSALLLTATQVLSAQTGGAFGRMPGWPGSFNDTYCSTPLDPTDTINGLPWSAPNVIDIHSYPAEVILDPGWGWINNPNSSGCQYYPDGAPVLNLAQPNGGYAQNCSTDADAKNPTGSSQMSANIIYTAINAFVQRWKTYGQIPSNASVVIGETDDYDPGGVGRDGISFPPRLEGTSCATFGVFGNILFDVYTDPVSGNHNVNFSCTPDWKWHRPASSAAAFENATGFIGTGLNRPDVVLRPWAPVSWATILTPTPLSGSLDRPYNVGGCSYQTNQGPLTTPATGMTLNMNVTTSQNCSWSAGFTPGDTNDHSWLTLTSGVWQKGTGIATATIAVNPNASSRQLQFSIAGHDVTIVQNGILPAKFGLTSPVNGASSVPFGAFTLTWSPSAAATQYDIYFGSKNPPDQVAVITDPSVTAYTVPAAPASTFYWKVVAKNANGIYDPAVATGTGFYQFSTQSMLRTQVGVSRWNGGFLEDSNGNAAYDAGVDRWIPAFVGPGGYVAGDMPVTGDWTGDGHAKVGVYRQSSGQWFLDANNNGVFDDGDLTYRFGGEANDVPVVGDWLGSGKSCVGVFRQGFFWVLDLNCNGAFDGTGANQDAAFPFGGLSGDVPVVGAWTGGATRVGVVRKYAPGGVPTGNPFYWVLDGGAANDGSAPANHQPDVVRCFPFGGLTGDIFVTGDWYNTGTSAAGVYRSGLWVLDPALPGAPLANHLQTPVTFNYGGALTDVPVTGKW
jgi:hypothetical protein